MTSLLHTNYVDNAYKIGIYEDVASLFHLYLLGFVYYSFIHYPLVTSDLRMLYGQNIAMLLYLSFAFVHRVSWWGFSGVDHQVFPQPITLFCMTCRRRSAVGMTCRRHFAWMTDKKRLFSVRFLVWFLVHFEERKSSSSIIHTKKVKESLPLFFSPAVRVFNR